MLKVIAMPMSFPARRYPVGLLLLALLPLSGVASGAAPVLAAAPTITVPPVVEPSDTAATITWMTDRPGTSRVLFGPATDPLTRVANGPSGVTRHRVVLTGLTPGTRYRYQAQTATAGGQAVVAPGRAFQTTRCLARPGRAAVGTIVTIRCTGFAPDERVALLWPGQTVPLATISVGGTGGGAAQLRIPTTPRGAYLVEAVDERGERTARAAVGVLPSLQLSPARGMTGTVVIATLRGFKAQETVRLFLVPHLWR